MIRQLLSNLKASDEDREEPFTPSPLVPAGPSRLTGMNLDKCQEGAEDIIHRGKVKLEAIEAEIARLTLEAEKTRVVIGAFEVALEALKQRPPVMPDIEPLDGFEQELLSSTFSDLAPLGIAKVPAAAGSR